MFTRDASVLDEVGGFDERFFMYGEDIDLCLRVAAAGWRVRYWPGATVIHAGRGSRVRRRNPVLRGRAPSAKFTAFIAPE